MSKEGLTKVLKSIYQKGYREGFADACDLMRKATMDLAQSMEEGLKNAIDKNPDL